jgi:hypothetical protein
MHTYAIILPDGRPHFENVSAREVEAICRELGYAPERIIRKLKRQKRVVLSDDVGEFYVQMEAKR